MNSIESPIAIIMHLSRNKYKTAFYPCHMQLNLLIKMKCTMLKEQHQIVQAKT